MHSPTDGSDERLDALFRAYREACPAPEPSVNFMPELWQRIDARRNFSYSLRRWAGALVTAAVAVCVAIGVFTNTPRNTTNVAYYSQSYVEVLAAAHETLPEAEVTEIADTTQVY